MMPKNQAPKQSLQAGAFLFALEIADVVAQRLRERHVEQRVFNKAEAAKYLGVSKTQIENFVSSGRLKTVRVDSDVRFDLRDLDAFIDAHKG